MSKPNVVIVVWDGFRPDFISSGHTPNLAAAKARGVTFSHSRVAFPSKTRVSSSTFVTGSYPDRHGICDNSLYIPELGALKSVNTGARETLLGIERLRGGRLFPVQTLGEVLAGSGRSLGVVSTASPGSATIVSWGADFVVNRAFAWPETVFAAMVERLGAVPPEAPTADLNRYFGRAAVDLGLSELQPDVLLVWFCEPDTALHAHGPFAPEVGDALRVNDQVLGELLERADPATHFFVLSDHGHSVSRSSPTHVGTRVGEALGMSPQVDFVVVGDSLYFKSKPGTRALARAVRALQEAEDIGPIFTEIPVAGALPLSAVHLTGPYAPDIKFTYAWADEHAGGHTHAGTGKAKGSSHGSFNPLDMRNFAFACGPRMKRDVVSDVPCGLVDIAPTVLALLDIDAPEEWDGRVLREAFVDGPQPVEVTVERARVGAETEFGRSLYTQELTTTCVDGTEYLEGMKVTRKAR